MTETPDRILPLELRLSGHRVQFKLDVTGRVKATCRAFPQMLVRDDRFDDVVRQATKRIRQLMAARIAERV